MKTFSNEHYIQVAKDEYGMAIRDNSKSQLIDIGKQIEHGENMFTLEDLSSIDSQLKSLKEMLILLDPKNPNDLATIEQTSFDIVSLEQAQRDIEAMKRRASFRLIKGGKQ